MMQLIAQHFSKKGRVIVPDLLGHGVSDPPKIEYTLDVFAESLIQCCQREKIERCIFIGLNYGANIGIEIAKKLPSLISHLVLIEPPFFMEPWIVELVEQSIAHPVKSEEIVDAMFMKASDEARAIALKALKSTKSFVKASVYRNLLAWDKKHAFKCSIPTLMIQTSQPFCVEERARTMFSNFQVGRVVGSGPWANLEVPTQVHSIINRFLEVSC